MTTTLLLSGLALAYAWCVWDLARPWRPLAPAADGGPRTIAVRPTRLPPVRTARTPGVLAGRL